MTIKEELKKPEQCPGLQALIGILNKGILIAFSAVLFQFL